MSADERERPDRPEKKILESAYYWFDLSVDAILSGRIKEGEVVRIPRKTRRVAPDNVRKELGKKP